MSETTELLQQLVAIDSINPDLVPGGAGEGNIARFVAAWFERAGLEVVVDVAAHDPTFQATVKTGLTREPFEVSLQEPIVQTVIQHAQRLLGREIAEVGGTGWMDSALLAAAGIPTVVFGPGGAGAHAIVEWSDLTQVQQCAEILIAVAEDFCQ